MKRKVHELYDEYRNGNVSRREFMKKLALVTGGTAAAVVILPGCTGATARAAGKSALNVAGEFITYPGTSGDMRAWISIPEGNEKYPGVIVIHENRGLVPHIRDVSNRMAMEGFVALAPDALSPLGGTPEDQDKGREMIGQLDRDRPLRGLDGDFGPSQRRGGKQEQGKQQAQHGRHSQDQYAAPPCAARRIRFST